MMEAVVAVVVGMACLINSPRNRGLCDRQLAHRIKLLEGRIH